MFCSCCHRCFNILCCFGCLTLFGCRDRVCRKLVFFPPLPMYAIEESKQDSQQPIMWLIDQEGHRVDPFTSPNFKFHYIRTRRRGKIASTFVRYPGSPTTILFSHGNATDIGCLRDHLIDMSQQLRVNVFTYDYSGYGLSSGKPNVANTLADVEAAYDLLVKEYPESSRLVIAYGQSLGSGPSVHLSIQRPLAGVIVHAGLMSALRVISPSEKTRWFDIYPNIDQVKQCKAPLFVIHGTEDEEIPVHHGLGIADAAANPYEPWIVEGAGHNNIEVNFREQLFYKLETFIRDIEKRNNVTPAAQSVQVDDIQMVFTGKIVPRHNNIN